MPLFDYQCDQCGHIHEEVQHWNVYTVPCPKCEGNAQKIISLSGVNTANNDAEWIRSIVEVVDKDSSDPVDVAMRTNPTRDNMKRWMKEKGLRHFEPGEERNNRPDPPDMDRLTEATFRERQKRHALEIRS